MNVILYSLLLHCRRITSPSSNQSILVPRFDAHEDGKVSDGSKLQTQRWNKTVLCREARV